MTDRALISLNPPCPDPTITVAALAWGDVLPLDDAAAITGLTPTQIVETIEARLPEVRTEYIRLSASGQLQELIGRTDLAKILHKLRAHIDEMTPGQLLATGSFMHQVSGLQHDRQLATKNEGPRFSVRVAVDGSPTPAGFRGIAINLSAVGQGSQKT